MNIFRTTDVRLRPLAAGDLDLVRGWRNSDRVRMNMYTTHVIAADEHRAWFARLQNNPAAEAFLFELKGEPIGFLSFTDIDRDHDRAFWAFYLGDENAPRGSGSVMECLALDHAFLTLGLHKLACEVIAFNAAVIKLHKRFGFVEEGVFRDDILREGQYHDVHRLALMRDDWLKVRDEMRAKIFEDVTS
jgi:UDP-4-amino-4,6-dideoxy-N-acetyl-beta-L-altrosamine N-acetyltransferase